VTRSRFLAAAGVLATLAMTTPIRADDAPEPAPPYPRRQIPPTPPPRTAPPPRAYYPPPPVVADPPPLSPFMRALYAPFYAAGLVVRYGFYYAIVAPIEVFARTIEYGVNGGVSHEPANPPSGDDR
jgi:hypothetical protein